VTALPQKIFPPIMAARPHPAAPPALPSRCQPSEVTGAARAATGSMLSIGLDAEIRLLDSKGPFCPQSVNPQMDGDRRLDDHLQMRAGRAVCSYTTLPLKARVEARGCRTTDSMSRGIIPDGTGGHEGGDHIWHSQRSGAERGTSSGSANQPREPGFAPPVGAPARRRSAVPDPPVPRA
jgi:hypothetical protein